MQEKYLRGVCNFQDDVSQFMDSSLCFDASSKKFHYSIIEEWSLLIFSMRFVSDIDMFGDESWVLGS